MKNRVLTGAWKSFLANTPDLFFINSAFSSKRLIRFAFGAAVSEAEDSSYYKLYSAALKDLQTKE